MLTGNLELGNSPRSITPIRKRAFYRALKRGELWAVVPYEHAKSGGVNMSLGPNKFAMIIADRNCPANTGYVIWPIERYLNQFPNIFIRGECK